MKHPFFEIDVEHAMSVAARLIDPNNPKGAELTIDQAITALENARKSCGFNWITGRVCHELLLTYREALPLIRKCLTIGLADNGKWKPTFSSKGNYSPAEHCQIEEIRRKYCKP